MPHFFLIYRNPELKLKKGHEHKRGIILVGWNQWKVKGKNKE
jgi:hypothetical protein